MRGRQQGRRDGHSSDNGGGDNQQKHTSEWVFFCVCLLSKFMGLKAKVCFTRDMGLGFG